MEVALGQLERVGLARVGGAGTGGADEPRVGLEELKLHRGAAALKTAAADAYEAARVRCCEARDDTVGVVGLELLGRLLEGFADEFARLKRARGAVDFDDLELFARDLLAGEPEVREGWSERFELLMVDELQDTNPREMAILGALDRGNLFTVGDEFQSIYGFRHADVGIFRERRKKLAGEDGVRVLSRNFRSRPAILAAINATFAPIFGPHFVPLVAGRDAGLDGLAAGGRDDAVGGAVPAGRDGGPDGSVAGGRDDGIDAAVAAGRDERRQGGPLVELMLSDTAGWQETAPGEAPGPGPPWRRAEAALLARRIDELIATGAARPEEIVVLLRYATAAGVYGQALTDLGIPIAAALGGGFYAAQEVSDLAAYVRVLANPLDDVALYGVLASPLCGLAGRQPGGDRPRRPGARSSAVGRAGGGRRRRPGGVGGAGGVAGRRCRPTRGDAIPDRSRAAGGGRPRPGRADHPQRVSRPGPQSAGGRPRTGQPAQADPPRPGVRGPGRSGSTGLRRSPGGRSARLDAGAARPAGGDGGRQADDGPRGQGTRVSGRLRCRPRPRTADRRADHPHRRRPGRTPPADAGRRQAGRVVRLHRAPRRSGDGGAGRGAADRVRRDDPGPRPPDPQRGGPLRPLADARTVRRGDRLGRAGDRRRPLRPAGRPDRRLGDRARRRPGSSDADRRRRPADPRRRLAGPPRRLAGPPRRLAGPPRRPAGPPRRPAGPPRRRRRPSPVRSRPRRPRLGPARRRPRRADPRR